MKIKLSLSQKLQLYIISVTAAFILTGIIYISSKIKNTAIKDAKAYTEEVVTKYAKQVEQKINTDLAIIRTLSQSVKTFKMLEEDEWKRLFAQMYAEVLKENNQLDDIWDSWEIGAYDPSWTKPYGRFCITAYNDPDGIRIVNEFKSMDGDAKQYGELKANNKESIEEPYLFSFSGNQSEAVLITDLTVPINDENGNYIGLVGADIRLEKLQLMVNKIKPYEESKAYLISHEGFYTSHPNSDLIGTEAEDDFDEDQFLPKIQKGVSFSFSEHNEEGEEFFFVFSPIHIGETHTPWSIGLEVPLKSIVEEAENDSTRYLFMGIGMLFIISLVVALIARKITQPLRKITKILQSLSEGKINTNMISSYKTGDEIEEISIALNKSINGFVEKSKFAEAIGEQKYDTELKLLSEDDALGKSLVEMQNSLIGAKEAENKRQEEDNKRKWANEGLAKFSEILRQNSNSIDELTSVFTRDLVRFCEANQATLFLQEGEVYTAKATYAYDRDKFFKSEIRPGEGLVGTCVLERKSIHITDIPDNYIKITSGLGEATPNSLFICPIQTEKQVLGIMEIASFNDFEDYQIEFIETICSNLAGVVESVKVNDNTKQLLLQTQQQTEEMKAQEEEMRQNLEELQTTQEEIAKKSSEMNGILAALNTSSMVVRLDTNGNIIDINDAFVNLLSTTKAEMIGINYREFSDFAVNTNEFTDLVHTIETGSSTSHEIKFTLPDGRLLWISQSFSAIFNESNTVESIMGIGIDITDNKEQEAELIQQNEEMTAQEEMMRLNMEEFEQAQTDMQDREEEMNGLMAALSSASFVVEYDVNGTIVEINDTYLDFLNMSKEEALGMNQKDHLKVNQKDDSFWNKIIEGEVWKGSTKLEINHQSYVLAETYTPIKNVAGEVVKVLKIANNQTDFQ